ncbi:hypothetical protein BJ322DRAFT_853393 [Thelephora terrestris]|uniref:F-box domain-containing protein n=1 Tax=Thelephora terrestris TaxID=56493 RepID=A0A9P6HF51_9AGAM|nr:hypothetical protein BJ322DRAFT_853393 [Thelephora terrestris]
MDTYPGADLTTEQLLDALFRRVKQQRLVCDRNVKSPDFRFMVYNQEEVLSKLLFEVRKMCSSMNVASCAPAEVITRIAIEGRLLAPRQYRDLISMSHVCKSWREAVISYPLLWNSISDESEMVTRMCLERSKTLSLTVSLSDFDTWSTGTRRLVGFHASRFETLSLSGSLFGGLSEIFTSLIPGEDPLLRELQIWGMQELNAECLIVHGRTCSPILSKDIPTLRKILLSSFPLTPQLSALRHLTCVELIDMCPTPVSNVLDLLANNPCLEQVSIGGSLDNKGSRRQDLSIALPRLRSFVVHQCDAVEILRCLHLPHLEDLKINIECSFEEVTLPQAYQPYSTFQLTRDFGFREIHLHTSPKLYLEICDYLLGGIAADFGELPSKTAEVLGPSTVRLIKHLRFWEDQAHLHCHPLEFEDALYYMEELETLALDCLPASLEEILLFLSDVECCPLLRTLIVRLPEGVAADAEEDSILDFVRCRADGDNAIRRLRVIVSSEEHVHTYSLVFGPFVQEVEILVCQPGEGDGRPWLVWED